MWQRLISTGPWKTSNSVSRVRGGIHTWSESTKNVAMKCTYYFWTVFFKQSRCSVLKLRVITLSVTWIVSWYRWFNNFCGDFWYKSRACDERNPTHEKQVQSTNNWNWKIHSLPVSYIQMFFMFKIKIKTSWSSGWNNNMIIFNKTCDTLAVDNKQWLTI